MAKPTGWKRTLLLVAAAFVILAVPVAYFAWYNFFRELPQPAWITEDPEMNFLYGSIGGEASAGFPYWLIVVLPRIFGEYIPAPGGYAAFGLPWEEGRELPVGFSKKTVGFDRVGFNCAICHATQYRITENETPTIVAGGGSHTTDVQGLLEFLSRCAEDERFNADTILNEIDLTYRLSFVERAMYKYLLIPLVRDLLREQGRSWAWTQHRPRWGPGRDAPMNLTKFILLGMPDDGSVDHTDFPSLWNLKTRVQEGRVWPADDYSLTADFSKLDTPLDRLMLMNLAGDTTSYRSVIIDSALGLQPPQEGGLPTPSPITPFFRQRVAEIEDWILNTPAPEYPLGYDRGLAAQGAGLFAAHCADCHESGRDNRLGTVIPLDEIGTDPMRAESWTRQAADMANEVVVNELGMERTPMSKPHDGYVALQLDGLWLRGPYLHNGAVPTVRALLEPPECRPRSFYRGYDLLDPVNLGFVALRCDADGNAVYDLPPGCEAKPVAAGCVPELQGWRHDTGEAGNSAAGHLWGTDLADHEKDALVEYLKQRDTRAGGDAL
jgi:mono/diheme cytochrome c family protein